MASNIIRISIILVLGLGLVAWLELRPEYHAPPPGDAAALPLNGFSHQALEKVLGKFTDAQGRVDYQAWFDDEQAMRDLRSYISLLAKVSPENQSKRFQTDDERMIYWINAYNALVISAILERWPLNTVLDVSAPIEVIQGLGFFYKQRYTVGGTEYSLYAIEHEKVIEQHQDPRVHFVLNCASGGCPAIRPQLPTGPALDQLLNVAAQEFVNDPKNVRYDEKTDTFIVSKIFEWYRAEFLAAVMARGPNVSASLLNYFQPYAGEGLASDLAQHPMSKVTFAEYDWSLNRSENSARASE